MRFLLLIVLFVGCSEPSLCQDSSAQEVSIQHYLGGGDLDGEFIKLVGGMGDAAAVTMTKVVAGGSLSSSQVQDIIEILGYAFAEPRLVGNPADRQPRAALFLLSYLDTTVKDASLRVKIDDVRKHILDNYKRYKSSLR
jgi:hypothetical protein